MNAVNRVDETESEPIEARCSHCFDVVRQHRLRLVAGEQEYDDFCSAQCSDAWLAWWSAAKSVMG